ncbi:MAG: helix-turn-helix transcriptional regulator [Planctomycetia bacterium]|nr:helix-turn-helix transcriptional regulator [Planctomycetia bacterium]
MTQTLDFTDIERIVKLLNESTDPLLGLSVPDRRRVLIEGLARLVDADVYIWSSTAINHDLPGDFMTTCVIDGGWKSEAEQFAVYTVISSPEFGRQGLQKAYDCMVEGRRTTFSEGEIFPPEDRERLMEIWKQTGFEFFLLSLYPLNENFSSNLGLHRRRGKPNFSLREKTIVQTVFSQVDWLHKYGMNEEAREVSLGLSPRERQTLIFLLSGYSHKNIASRMNISQHTVNDYVKQLHKQFGVNTRAELQAFFFVGVGADPNAA